MLTALTQTNCQSDRRRPLGQRLLVVDSCFFGGTLIEVQIEFVSAKTDRTVALHGLAFERVGEVFAGQHVTQADDRLDYAEDRFITVGWLDARLVVLVWTPRGEVRRIISMRKANDREQAFYAQALG